MWCLETNVGVRACEQVLLNPFYKPHSKIESAGFDTKVQAMVRKLL